MNTNNLNFSFKSILNNQWFINKLLTYQKGNYYKCVIIFKSSTPMYVNINFILIH